MRYEDIKTNYPVIDSVITLCKPKFQEIVRRINDDLLSKKENVLTEKQVETIFVSCTYNLVKSMYNYIEKTDTLFFADTAYVRTGFVLTAMVVRDGQSFDLNTNVIVAGGYNVQCAHYRYITKTQLPRIRNSTALTPIQKIMKNISEAKRIEKKIQENLNQIDKILNVYIPKSQAEYQKYINTTPDNIKKEFIVKYPELNCQLKDSAYSDWVDGAVKRELEYIIGLAEGIQKFWLPSYNKDIKNLKKRNALLEQKLLELEMGK